MLCVNWEEEENYGINPLNSSVYSLWYCDVPFKSEAYCLMNNGTLYTYVCCITFGKDTQGIDSLYGIS